MCPVGLERVCRDLGGVREEVLAGVKSEN